MTRLVIDPVTRVGGHLRLEVELDGGTVADAWVSGTMYRGLERILEGRDARDAWLYAQRTCGTCGVAHALASARAVENALELTIPTNARLLRNLIAGTQLVVDHVAGFYQSQMLDWVDLDAALTADPEATARLARSLGDWPTSTATAFAAAQRRLAANAGAAVSGSSIAVGGPFAGGFAGHPAYALPPEADLMIAAHAIEALDWRRAIMRLPVILGGKSPHPQTFLVGGMSVAAPWGGPLRPSTGAHQWDLETTSPPALSANGLADIGQLIDEANAFVTGVHIPDVTAIVTAYLGRSAIDASIGHYLAFGEFAEDNAATPALLLPRGRVMGADLSGVVAVGETGVAENLDHAWYAAATDDPVLAPPADVRTAPAYDGPRPPYASLDGFDRYSWVKAPRYEDDPMEVGALARLLVTVATPGAIAAARTKAVAQMGMDAETVFSGLGRTAARAIEAGVVAGRLGPWLTALKANLATGDLAMAEITKWDPETWPAQAEGVALAESARGAVGHWVSIRDHRIDRYQIVDASTWNASPRDNRGRRGAIEQALVGVRVADPDRPLEILRTVRSFAPCLTCAVH